jgi:hypothetical protein
MADRARHTRLAAARLRLGIVLWLVSWIPFPIILGVSGKGRYLIWGVQFVIGAIGLVLAGSAFFDAVKHLGWKRAPRALVHALVHGDKESALPV